MNLSFRIKSGFQSYQVRVRNIELIWQSFQYQNYKKHKENTNTKNYKNFKKYLKENTTIFRGLFLVLLNEEFPCLHFF